MVKTLSSIYDSKQVVNYARNNIYLSHVSVENQMENFAHMISSSFIQELHFKCWELAMRGNELMMTRLRNAVNEMLTLKAKGGTNDLDRQIVFLFSHQGKTSSIDAKEFRFYNQTLLDLKLLPSTDSSGSGVEYPILPCYNQDDPAFMAHKYIPRPLWHHACEVLFQNVMKFYRRPSGPQLAGYNTLKSFQGS